MSLLSRLTALFRKPSPLDPSAQKEAALAAMTAGDYPRVLALLRPLAEGGDVESQGNLGVLLLRGLGGPVAVK